MVDFEPRTDLSVQMYPHQATFSRVYLDIIDAWGWTSFAVIFQESDSIVHFKDFFPQASKAGWDIRLFQLQPDRPYREVLWQVKRLKLKNILLDVRTDHLLEVLRQAQQVGIMTERHNYLITSLDVHTLPLENYRHSQTNITSLRIVREQHPVLQSLLADWPAYVARFMPRAHSLPVPAHLTSQSAMIFDGVQILALGLAEFDQFSTREISCGDGEDSAPWQFGASLLNYVRQVHHEGLTGYVAFEDGTGFRSKLSFEVISTMATNFEVIATWTDGKLFKSTAWERHSPKDEVLPLYRLSAKLTEPYLMNAKAYKELRGNDQYEGYVVDMMNEVASMLNFRYEIHLVKDRQSGSPDPETGKWNGR